ncbi:hypothetical protein [Pseudonocardia acidicola]|uniref:STAS domain-containing protein n=1 Tax=Pseudonocardia acidicola TaxID=2724939 RepID=A0ABX1SMC1_9PSEU|nr:hypothetical protein [Pseudonocardia acidicola]NMI01567.1 hypothetical protein [Pseudonocardia acidicola]
MLSVAGLAMLIRLIVQQMGTQLVAGSDPGVRVRSLLTLLGESGEPPPSPA